MAEKWLETPDRQVIRDVRAGKITGRRVFLRSDDKGSIDPVDLPAVGSAAMIDINGTTITNCKAVRRIETFTAGDQATPRYEYQYETPDFQGPQINRDASSRRYEIGVEQVGFGTPHDFVWATGGAAVEQPIYKDVLLQSFTRSINDLSKQRADNLQERMAAQAHTINSAQFEGKKVGTVKFEGASGGNYNDEDGNEKWSFELAFAHRVIKDPLGSPTTDTWLYMLNGKTGAWDKVQTSGGNALFSKSDLNQLFTV